MAGKNKTEYQLLLELAGKMDPSYRTALENASKGVNDLGEKAKDAEHDLGVMDIALGNLIANGITALISAAGNAARSIYNLAEETREFRQDMATLETAFDGAGFSAETATDTWKDLYAVFGEDDRAVEAANNISRMASTEEDLAKWVNITTGIWGTYQDALPVEGLAEAAGETAKVGKVTGVMADALNWSSEAAEMFAEYMSDDVLTAEDAFNEALAECTTEAERNALITNTLTALYGDAADTYRETADSVMDANTAAAEYALTQAEIGEKIEPVTTAVQEGITEVKQAFLEMFGEVDFDALATKVSNAFGWLVNTGIPFLVSNMPTLLTLVGGVTAALLAQAAATAIKSAADKAAAQNMTLAAFAQQKLNAAMKANVIGLIITGITLLVSGFMYLWNNCAGFRNFWIGLWEKIKSTVAVAVAYFQPVFDNIKRYFSGIINFVKGVFTGNWKQAWQGVVDIFGGIFGALGGLLKAPLNGAIKLINWFIGKANKISIGPLPNWSILGEYAGATLGFNIPKIPALAEGGIVTAPTLAMVGEGQDDEAVLPLSKLGDLMGSTETISIVYSPNITVMPGANAEDVKAATAQSFEQFKAYMDRYLRERKRLQFA